MNFIMESGSQAVELDVNIEQLIIAGWTGRDSAAVQHHIDELAAIGVSPPSRVPLFYRVAASQLTQGAHIQVVGNASSGEVEPLIFQHRGELYLSISSDHTDREIETQSVCMSKQICAKPVARQAWQLKAILPHWDDLELSSWVEERGEVHLYQKGTLAKILPPLDLLARCKESTRLLDDGYAISCGTLPVIGGIRPTGMFQMELHDPVTSRRIFHEYRVEVLPAIS